MPERGGQLDKADRRPSRVERVGDDPAFGGGVQPIGIKADQTEPRFRSGEGFCQLTAVLLGQIEIVHCPGDIEVGIGIEPVGKA